MFFLLIVRWWINKNNIAPLAIDSESEDNENDVKIVKAGQLEVSNDSNGAARARVNSMPECLQTFQTELPRNQSVIPQHMLMNPKKKKKKASDKRRNSINDGAIDVVLCKTPNIICQIMFNTI